MKAAAILLCLLCATCSAAKLSAHAKILGKLKAREQTESLGFLESQLGTGCDKNCDGKCQASTSCKDDSCKHDKKSCKANEYCGWDGDDGKCDGTIPTASPTPAPSPVPTTAAPTYVTCDDDVLDTVVEATITDLVTYFNEDWSALAESTGLDPWEDVLSTTVDIPKAYFCDEACAVSGGSSCEKSYVNIDLTEMTGLGSFQLDTIDVDSMTVVTNDGSCPLPDNGKCVFSASFPVTGALASGGELKLMFKDLDFDNKCEWWDGSTFYETPVSFDSLTCTSTDATAKGTLTACFSECGDLGGAILSAVISDFEIESSTTYSCSSEGDFWSDAEAYLVPLFAGDIYDAVNGQIETELNNEFGDLLDDYNLDTCSSRR